MKTNLLLATTAAASIALWSPQAGAATGIWNAGGQGFQGVWLYSSAGEITTLSIENQALGDYWGDGGDVVRLVVSVRDYTDPSNEFSFYSYPHSRNAWAMIDTTSFITGVLSQFSIIKGGHK